MEKYSCRNDVPEKYKWDLTEFFKNNEEFELEFNKAVEMVDNLKKYKGCTTNANTLYEFLNNDIDTIVLVEDLYVYSFLINDQELGNSESIERKNKCEDLYSKYTINTNFFCPELLKLSTEDYSELFESKACALARSTVSDTVVQDNLEALHDRIVTGFLLRFFSGFVKCRCGCFDSGTLRTVNHKRGSGLRNRFSHCAQLLDEDLAIIQLISRDLGLITGGLIIGEVKNL